MDDPYMDHYEREDPYRDHYDKFILDEDEEDTRCVICGNVFEECVCNEYDDF